MFPPTAIVVSCLSAFPQLFSGSVHNKKSTPAFQPSDTYYNRLASRVRSRKNLKAPNSIDEDLFDLTSVSSPGNADIVQPPIFQSRESQHHVHGHAVVPDVLEALPVCYSGQSAGAHGGAENEGGITHEIKYQVACQWA